MTERWFSGKTKEVDENDITFWAQLNLFFEWLKYEMCLKQMMTEKKSDAPISIGYPEFTDPAVEKL